MPRISIPYFVLIAAVAGCGDAESPRSDDRAAGMEQGGSPDVVVGRTVIPDDPVCPECEVVLTTLVELEDSPDAPIPAAPSSVVEDGLGRIWLMYANELPLIYEPDGRLLRELGPRGDGPGEYQYPAMLGPLPGDSVLLFEWSRASLIVLDPELTQSRAIRMDPRAAPRGVQSLHWPDSVLVSTSVSAYGSSLDPYRLYDLSDTTTLLASFGGEGPAPDPLSAPRSHRIVPAAGGGFWAWRSSSYELDHWTMGGVRLQTIERTPEWFGSESLGLAQPGIQDVVEDAQGRLWVIVHMPRPNWEDALPVLPPGVRELPVEAIEFDKLYRTTVEVLLPDEKRVLARTDLDVWIVSALPGNRAAIYGTTDLGYPFVRIVRLNLAS